MKTEKILNAAENSQTVAGPDPEELVEYMAPLLGAGERQDLFVGCNGETIRIRRGEPLKIKRKFLEVLEHARQQELEDYRLRFELSRKPLQ